MKRPTAPSVPVLTYSKKRTLSWWYLVVGFTAPVTWFLGWMCNAAVITANGGLMPSQYPVRCAQPISDTVIDSIHTCMTHASHLKFLADWIYSGDGYMSPGDLLLIGGEWFLCPGLVAMAFLIAEKFFREEG